MDPPRLKARPMTTSVEYTDAKAPGMPNGLHCVEPEDDRVMVPDFGVTMIAALMFLQVFLCHRSR